MSIVKNSDSYRRHMDEVFSEQPPEQDFSREEYLESIRHETGSLEEIKAKHLSDFEKFKEELKNKYGNNETNTQQQ